MKTKDFAKAKAMASRSVSQIPTEDEAEKEIAALRAAGIDVQVPEGGYPTMSDQDFDPFANPEMMTQAHETPAMVEAPVEVPPVVEAKPEEKKKDPLDIISEMPGGPTKAQLIQWKATYPEVLFLPLKDDEIYIYRYLTHIEWHKQLSQQQALMQDEAKLKDAVINRCLLWPKLDPIAMNTQRAGLRDLLYEVIMQSSYFISSDAALGLVRKL